MSRRQRNSSPFSLFAFQDIITAVTGVMILVTMLLTLELLQRKEQSPAVKTTQTIGDVQRITNQVEHEIAKTEAALDAQSELLKFDQAALNQQISELSARRQQLESDAQDLRMKQDDARQRHESILQAEQEQEATPQLLASIQDEIASTREHLERLRRTNRMIFNPTAGDQKQPWLVEFDGEQITVARVGESRPPQMFQGIDPFLKWSRGRSLRSEYFVLLIKPDTISRFEMVRETLTDRGFDVGYDVLSADQTAIDPKTGAAP